MNYVLSFLIMWCEKDREYLADCIDSIPPGSEIICIQHIVTNDNTKLDYFIYDKEETIYENSTKLIKGVIYTHKQGNDDTFRYDRFRNTIKELATGLWCFTLDADERIQIDTTTIKELIAIKHVIAGISVKVVNWLRMPDGSVYNELPRNAIRCWRNSKEFNYEWYCHELIGESITEKGYQLLDLPIMIKHLGYKCDKETAIQKHLRNFGLIVKNLIAKPYDKYLLKILFNTMLGMLDLGLFKIDPEHFNTMKEIVRKVEALRNGNK